MIKSRIPVSSSRIPVPSSGIPVPSKIQKIPASDEEIKTKQKKIDAKSGTMTNKAVLEKKIQSRPVVASKFKGPQPVSSQIAGERHDQPSSKDEGAAPNIKRKTAPKLDSKSLNSKARCLAISQKPVSKPQINRIKYHNKKTEKNPIMLNSKLKHPKTGPKAVSKPQIVVEKCKDKMQEKSTKDESEQRYLTKVCEKENVPNFTYEFPHIAQQNDKFEANEVFRQLILSGKELTPSMLQWQSGSKSSLTFNRPSIYKPFIMPADPSKEALKALENLKLSNPRPSQVKRGSIFSTPMKSQDCFYHPSDPYREALKSLETLRKKKLVQSKKKVTFSFLANNVPLQFTEHQIKEVQIDRNSESRLTDISEKDETGQNSSRENSRKISAVTEELVSPCVNLLESSALLIGTNSTDQNSKPFEAANSVNQCLKLSENMGSQNISEEKKVELMSSNNSAPFPKENFNAATCISSNFVPIPELLTDDCTQSCDSVCADPEVITGLLSKDKDVSNLLEVDLQQIRSSSLNYSINLAALRSKSLMPKSSRCSMEKSILTPCPVSCKPHSLIENSGSPEFLGDKSKNMTSLDVPICTPLVLSRLGKENEDEAFSPIRLKLNFSPADLESKKKKSPLDTQSPDERNIYNGILLRDIPTARKVLDQLADEECSVILLKQNVPIACSRSMRNPVALILTEGDESHFIPVGSLQCQE